jgi:hypothetical protein
MNIGQWMKSNNPVIPGVIHHHQNPLEYICQIILYAEQSKNKATIKTLQMLSEQQKFGSNVTF